MNIDYNHISLEQLKNDISQLEDQQLGDYFDDKLAVAFYRDEKGYLNIIKFFNHLKDEYNKCIAKNNGQEIKYHDTLFKSFNWFLPLLNPYHKIIAQANICILTDDEQDHEFHEKYFRDSLNNANRLIEATGKQVSEDDDKRKNEKKALCWALDSIGYLNIREHNYEYAILCIRICLDALSTLNVETPELYNLYINSIVRLANCYEYTDRPWSAVNCVLGLGNLINDEATEEVQQIRWEKIINSNAEKIRSKIIAYYNLPERELENVNDTIDIVKEICDLLFDNPPKNSNYGILKWDITSRSYFNTLKYYIHVLAHCISEYAAKIRIADYSHPYCSTLQIISRFLLDWLVLSCQEEALVTCQATVRAENDACPEAIKLLLKRYAVLEKKLKESSCTTEEQNELQEIEFFLFYFAEQELRYNYTDNELKKIFDQFSNKFFESASSKAQDGDYDSLFHFYVIRFKYLFKQKVDEFMHFSNNRLDMAEVDHVFLSMCKCKGLCSEQIFKGLIDECQRLEELFALFQELQWLNSRKISKEKLNLFKQLWVLHDKSDKTFDTKEIVSKIHDEIIKRNKILILAPIKNAPSCSFEYENIQRLLELPICTGDTSRIPGDEFVSSFNRLRRNHPQTIQYFLNSSNEYSKLKWAIFYPNESSFAYLYYRNDSAIKYDDIIEYCGIIPVYLDKEHEEIKDILKNIDDDISDEFIFSVLSRGICANRKCEDDSLCNTFLLEPDDECNLRKLIYELLTFLEFDFHAARHVGNPNNEYFLINYPKKGNFEILAFDEQLPSVAPQKAVCDICDQCFTKLPQSHKDETPSGLGTCKIYPTTKLEEFREKVYREIDSIENISATDKKLIKSGKATSYKTTQREEYTRLCFCLIKCIAGKCDRLGEQQCETCKLLKEHHFV